MSKTLSVRNYRAWDILYKIVMSYTEVVKVENDEDVDVGTQLSLLMDAKEAVLKSIEDIFPEIREESASTEQKLMWKALFDRSMFNWGQADLYLHLNIVTILFGRYLLTMGDESDIENESDKVDVKKLALGVLGHMYFIELSNMDYGIQKQGA